MKLLLMVAMVLLGGCATTREETLLTPLKVQAPVRCSDYGLIELCQRRGVRLDPADCQCVKRSALRRAFGLPY